VPSGPHILGVLHLAEMSGPARSLRPWLERAAEGGRLEIAVPADGAAAGLYRRHADVTTVDYAALTLPRSPREALAFATRARRQTAALRAAIRDTRPDLVVVATSTLPWALAAARLERVPAIAYVGEIVPRGPGAARALGGRAVVELTRRLAHRVVCCSQAAAAAFGGARNVQVIAPGIDPPRDGDGAAFRARTGLGGARPLFVAVGNISRHRGQDVLLEALAIVRRELPDAGCALVGAPHPRAQDVAYDAELRALAARLGIEHAVAFAGYVDPVADAYAAADAVVNTIRGAEGLGRAALEALAAGLPVVASRVPGVAEALREGRDALLVEPGDPPALAAALVRIARDRELAERLVRSGGEHVRDTYAIARGAEEFAAVAAAVLAE
jgi:glycosyltransferase involved in cell wall biosynthesis